MYLKCVHVCRHTYVCRYHPARWAPLLPEGGELRLPSPFVRGVNNARDGRLCGGVSLCKVTFISRISHYVKERIVVIMFRRRRIVAACSPVVSVCTRWRRIVAVPAMCVRQDASPPMCVSRVGVPAITFAGVPAITFAGVPAITFAGGTAITFAGGGYPKVPCPLSSSSSPPGVTVPLP